MQFTLHHDVFDPQSDVESLALLDLLLSVARDTHQHAVLTLPLYSLVGANGPVDTWLAQHSAPVAAACRSVLSRAALVAAGARNQPTSHPAQPRHWHFPGALEVHVERRQTSDWRNRLLTVADAVDLFREPLHLVMENSRTELAFVRALAGPTNGATLRSLVDRPGRIIAHGGGGGEAKKWVEALAEGPETAPKWRRMLRAWILFDQDAGELDARHASTSAVQLMEACEKVFVTLGVGLSWICLRRRELESYVPDNGLHFERAHSTDAFVNQVLAWRNDPTRQDWAWALDLKKGVFGDLHPNWKAGLSPVDVTAVKGRTKLPSPTMLKSPFSALTAIDVSTLQKGFGDALGRAFRRDPDPPWSSGVRNEYDRGPADQAPRLSFVQSLFDRM